MKKVLLVLGLSLVLAGCYHEGATSGTPLPASEEEANELSEGESEGVVVQISEYAFAPESLTVEPGETITVINMDAVGHTMTSDDGEAFDSGIVEQNESFTFNAPVTPGEYPFHCTPHPNMKATLTVEG